MGAFSFLKGIFYDSTRAAFFSDVFICFNLDHETLLGRMERLRWRRTREIINKVYPVKNGKIPIRAMKDVRDFVNIYPFSYLCAMAKSADQGMCKKSELEQNIPKGLRKKDLIVLEIDGYCFYIPKQSLEQDRRIFGMTMQKIDYIFSPFLLMYSFIKPILEDGVAVYALLEHARLFVMVSNHRDICYSKFYPLERTLSDADLEVQTQDIQQESYKHEEEMLQSFLKSIETNLIHMDTNAPSQPVEEESTQDPKALVDSMIHATDIIKYLQESIKTAYDNPNYHIEDFIQKVWVLYTYEISYQLIDVLEDELMLEIEHAPMSLVERMSILAKKEQYNEAEL
ncbi:hypothetical protein [Helicobacter ailurogastricus]|uniref:Uncharacterized protein n=1 Tax=Helicobacter ailurogastricus TaxID=1578720 RepID=A0A0K2X5T1_9HELI|nr:hypothetical protein [Helicobacter ailurogastricus]CRF41386.1 hypothetical protein HAL011_11800 [Helicobacter ailurogastricus]CRF41997.1 hypothetical protein HAL013_01460 [Helicobacter ailurogastricus]CRF43637.1 hypothetical protein HAL09_01830 [Helicobacter ailurogastricus]CRF53004.1 hypothetical protein HAL07_14690 [Helicobacter ailurogastricus]BDQ28472.1 hypothetical protein ASB7_03090 [Helicobacter ailurogastricus]